MAAQLKLRSTAGAIFFCSAHYDLDVLGPALADRFDDVELVGCSTAGEIAADGYQERSIVGVSFCSDDYVVVADRCDDLRPASLLRVCEMTQSLLRRLRVRAPGATPQTTFAILLIDGLSGIEEPVLSAINRELGAIPLIGGSAGDNLRFRETVIYHGGEFHASSAVLVLVHTWLPFEVFKTQHFVRTNQKMVVTEADPVRRLVTEINAEPADEEYARQFGVEGQPLQPMLLATHPLLVRVGGDDYARSIQKVNEDGSLTFYCAIDEGVVLAAGTGTDLVPNLDRLLRGIRERLGVPDAILGFDCIFRRLELRENALDATVSRMLAANNVVGFSTYGEQYNAMHLNQTFSGVAFGRDPARR